MRLIFLGTGGYRPNERRHTASLLLPDVGIALDAGTGFFRMPERLQTASVDVFLSHAHLDHVCGLTFPLVPLLQGQIQRLRVHGAAETIAAVKEHLFASSLFPVDPPFEWCPLPHSQTEDVGANRSANRLELADGRGVVSWQQLDHPGGSLGYRIDWPDRSLAYITDTTAPGNYTEFIRGVDVLIHECYFPDHMIDWARKTGHSCSSDVARVASAAAVKQLYLVHSDPQNSDDDPIGIDGIHQIFDRSVLAEDLQEIDF